MKNSKYILWLSCLVFLSSVFVSCNSEDEYFEGKYQDTPIVIDQIYLEDYESSVPDRPVDFARLGQLIRIEGKGLYGMKKVFINGYDTYFNRAYVSDNSMLVQINSNTPVVEAEPEVRDIIRLVKDNVETAYDFTIRAASPSVTHLNNTLPQAGEVVYVYGRGLHETAKVTLPGGKVISTGIENDPEGEWYSFVMPADVTEGGSIYSEGANGSAATPAYFNNTSSTVLNFDGNGKQGFWSWSATGSMINDEDLVDDPHESGRGKSVQFVPERLIDAGGIASGKPRAAECWTAGNDNDADDWSRMYTQIPANTPLTEVAFQFDVYVPEPWSGTGYLQIVLFNNFNFAGIGSDDDGSSNQVAFYVPWIRDGEVVPFQTEGWQTVTIPFSTFNKYAAQIENKETPVFQDVVDQRNAATYKNFGIGFVNTDFTYEGVEVTATNFSSRIYLDNWRVVPFKSITISDYPEDEGE